MIICPTCGGAKKNHSARQWDIHKKMYEIYRKARLEIERQARKVKR